MGSTETVQVLVSEALPAVRDEYGAVTMLTCPDWECEHRLRVANSVIGAHGRCRRGSDMCPYSGACVIDDARPQLPPAAESVPSFGGR